MKRLYYKRLIAVFMSFCFVFSGAVPAAAEDGIYEINETFDAAEAAAEADTEDEMGVADVLPTDGEISGGEESGALEDDIAVHPEYEVAGREIVQEEELLYEAEEAADAEAVESEETIGQELAGSEHYDIEADVPSALNAEGADEPMLPSSNTVPGHYEWEINENGVLSISKNSEQDGKIDQKGWGGYENLIKEVNIREGIGRIGSTPFRGMTQITNLTIASTVSEIGAGFVDDCTNLSRITVDSNNSEYVNGSDGRDNTTVYRKNNKMLVCCAPAKLGTLTIDEDTVEIMERACYGRTGITGQLKIPRTVKKIGAEAFSGCTGLSTLLYFDENRFDNDNSNLQEIGQYAFGGLKFDKVFLPVSDNAAYNDNAFGGSTVSEFYKYASSSGVTIDSDITYGAQKKYLYKVSYNHVVLKYTGTDEIAKEYATVSYNKSYAQTYGEGQDYIKPVRDNTVFLGWKLENGKKIDKNTTITVASEDKHKGVMTLIPDWYTQFLIQFTLGEDAEFVNHPSSGTQYSMRLSANDCFTGAIWDDVIPEKNNADFLQWRVTGGESDVINRIIVRNDEDGTVHYKKMQGDQDEELVYFKSDMVLTAEFKDFHTINFYENIKDKTGTYITSCYVPDGESFDGIGFDLEAVSTNTFAHKYPSKAGYRYYGWFNADDNDYPVSGNYKIYQNMSLYPKYERYLKIVYDYDDGRQSKEAGALYGDEVQLFKPTAVDDLHVFKHWVNSNNNKTYKATDSMRLVETTNYSVVSSDSDTVEMKAVWELKKKVDFVDEFLYEYDGSTYDPIYLVSGSTIIDIPDAPSDIKGYRFVGWFTGRNGEGEEVVKNEFIVNEDMTVYACWRKLVRVTFVDRGELVDDYNGIMAGLPFKLEQFPSDPVWQGYIFSGWYTAESGGEPFTAGTIVTGDITLYAQWEDDPTQEKGPHYTVSFDSMGGSGVASQRVSENEMLVEPDTPVWEDHKFQGWYIDKLFSKAWNFTNDVVTKEMTLYAKWVSWTEEDKDREKGIYWKRIIVKQEASLASYFKGSKLEFFSDNAKVAKINQKKKLVKGKREGIAMINCVSENGDYPSSVKLIVIKQSLSQMSVPNTSTSINAANYLSEPGILPDRWRSSNPKIASIDPKTGIITVKGRGKAKITAYYGKIKVKGKLIAAVPEFTKKIVKMKTGATAKLKLKGIDELDIVSWNLLDENKNPVSRNAIAEIDDGYVTANLAGTGYISASANGETATCKLIIEKPVLKKKTLDMTTNSKAKLKLSNTKLKYVEWKSMNEDVAYVDPVSGTVYSIGTGTTTVTTEAGGITSSCRIVVKEKGSGKAANK